MYYNSTNVIVEISRLSYSADPFSFHTRRPAVAYLTVSVCAPEENQLELSTADLVAMQCVTVTPHAISTRQKISHMDVVIKRVWACKTALYRHRIENSVLSVYIGKSLNANFICIFQSMIFMLKMFLAEATSVFSVRHSI